MNADCQEYRDRITDLVTGALSEEQARELHAHVENCTSCTKYAMSLQSQEEQIMALFASYDADMEAREQQVIEAVAAIDVPSEWTIRSIMARIADSSFSNRAAAAVVIAVVTLYFIITMAWISQITEYMKMGTECIRLSSGV